MFPGNPKYGTYYRSRSPSPCDRHDYNFSNPEPRNQFNKGNNIKPLPENEFKDANYSHNLTYGIENDKNSTSHILNDAKCIGDNSASQSSSVISSYKPSGTVYLSKY